VWLAGFGVAVVLSSSCWSHLHCNSSAQGHLMHTASSLLPAVTILVASTFDGYDVCVLACTSMCINSTAVLWLQECPICTVSYPSMNTASCCSARVCTECFVHHQTASDPPGKAQCPFCKSTPFAVRVSPACCLNMVTWCAATWIRRRILASCLQCQRSSASPRPSLELLILQPP
jgi:hypothetical protein